MSDLTDKVLNELREKDVRPVPAWRFVLNSVLTWIGFAVFVFLGAQSVSIILFLLSDHDWTELAYFRGGPLGYVFTVLPYVWVAALAVLIVVAYLDFRKTKGGYRFRPFMVVGSVIAISVVAGVGLHFAGMGKRADAMFEVRVPQYRLMVPRGIQIWDNPQAGRLVGSVENLRADGSFDLIAPDGESWTVHVESGRGGKTPPMMGDGVPVRVVGEPDERGEFRAKAVLPWGPGLEFRPSMHLPQRDTDTEDSIYPARIISERQSRPSVHPVEPFSRSTSNQYPNE